MSKFFHASFMFSLLALINSPLGQSLSQQRSKEDVAPAPIKQSTRLYTIEEINQMAASNPIPVQQQETSKLSFEQLLVQAQNAKPDPAHDFSERHIANLTNENTQKASQMGALGGVIGLASKIFGATPSTNSKDVQNNYAIAQAEAQYILQSGDTKRFAEMIDKHAGFLNLASQNTNPH